MLNTSSVTANIPAVDIERARSFHVADVAAEVAELEAKGVTFDTYEMPGVTWDGVIASLGDMGKAAWFKDSENNVLCIDDATAM